ncbi:MAG: CoA ester lyase [Neisseria sp.]|nr:CoA ester lyase [Neisseria sp.]
MDMKKALAEILLFVPGTRLDLAEKAYACGADAPVIDWEDTVADGDKARVRRETAGYAAGNGCKPVWIRINSEKSPFFADDLACLPDIANLAGVLLPKTESAAAVCRTAKAAGGRPVVAMIESAAAWLGAAEIAKAEGLSALTYGCLDLLAELSCTRNSEAGRMMLNRLRGDLLLAGTANGLYPPLEGIFPELKNDAAYREYLQFGRDLGFSGALCLHPQQVAVARSLNENRARLQFAARVLAEYQRSGAEVFQLDGQMIDKPVIEEAKRLLQGGENSLI